MTQLRSFNQDEFQQIGFAQETNIISKNRAHAFSHSLDNSIYIKNLVMRIEFKKYILSRNKWKEMKTFISDTNKIISLQPYREIVLLGKIAIPWIIRDLRKAPDHWFHALKEITGENPISEKNLGNIIEMSNDWIKWAQENGYI